MAELNIQGSSVGNQLQQMLMAESIEPGDPPSYELCKVIYEYHPLGGKMVDAPIALAQSEKREVEVQTGPKDELVKAFDEEWERLSCDDAIANTARQARMYGAAAVGLLEEGIAPTTPVDFAKLYQKTIAFNVWDPLNLAGSIVLNQLPNALDFLKPTGVTVTGQQYHRSRVIVKFNEKPIYLGWTTSAFGYVGRSVYQRALFPLKSFVQSMITDDLVIKKAGVLVAKLEQPGSVIDQPMRRLFGRKREVIKDAQTGNVISVGLKEEIATLNMQNLDGAYGMARTNDLKNIATAADMPAQLLENETMVSGFGEGTEDTRRIAVYVDRFRMELLPLYRFFEQIVMYRAWNPEFYATIQQNFAEEYGDVDYQTAFYSWKNSFSAQWPDTLKEPESEKIKVAETKLKAIVDLLNLLAPTLDPENKARVIQWACDNINEMDTLFKTGLELDFQAIADHLEEQNQQQAMTQQAPGAAPEDHLAALGDAAKTLRLIK